MRRRAAVLLGLLAIGAVGKPQRSPAGVSHGCSSSSAVSGQRLHAGAGCPAQQPAPHATSSRSSAGSSHRRRRGMQQQQQHCNTTACITCINAAPATRKQHRAGCCACRCVGQLDDGAGVAADVPKEVVHPADAIAKAGCKPIQITVVDATAYNHTTYAWALTNAATSTSMFSVSPVESAPRYVNMTVSCRWRRMQQCWLPGSVCSGGAAAAAAQCCSRCSVQ